MAPSEKLPQSSSLRKSPFFRSGVLTLHGFGIKVRVWNGHLKIEDGVGLDRRHIRLSRVDFGANRIRRIVCIGADGYVTLNALKWFADVGASFIALDRIGKVLFVSAQTGSSETKLRRAQAQAHDSGVAVVIAKELMHAKVNEQAQLVRVELHNAQTAEVILGLCESLAGAETVEEVRSIEARAAHSYWSAWTALPILWPKADLRRIPEHWRIFGPRRSLLSGASPRLAVGPGNACLNYLGAILESEARIALSVLGLDVGLGMLHADISDRSSLVFDVMEPCRVEVDRWLLRFLRSPLSRKWFFETTEGQCRIMTDLCVRLSETAPLWQRAVAPWTEFVQRKLWEMIPKPGRRMPATRLTQNRKRIALNPEPVAPVVPIFKPRNLCCICGVPIRSYQKYCVNHRTVATQTPQAQARRSETVKRERIERKQWNPETLPKEFNRNWYKNVLLPLLVSESAVKIAGALCVSKSYAREIRDGKLIPHMRHWTSLVQLAGVSVEIKSPNR